MTVSLFWSEYDNGRWQSPRTSDPDRPIDLGARFTVMGDLLQLLPLADRRGMPVPASSPLRSTCSRGMQITIPLM